MSSIQNALLPKIPREPTRYPFQSRRQGGTPPRLGRRSDHAQKILGTIGGQPNGVFMR